MCPPPLPKKLDKKAVKTIILSKIKCISLTKENKELSFKWE